MHQTSKAIQIISLIYIALCFWPSPAQSNQHTNAIIELSDQTPSIVHPPSIHYLTHTADMTIDTLISGQPQQWLTPSRDIPNLGFTSSIYWIKGSVINNATVDHRLRETQWLLEIAYVLLADIDLFLVQDGKVFRHLKGGNRTSFNERHYPSNTHVFPLPLHNHQPYEFYIKVSGPHAIQVPIIFWQEPAFLESNEIRIIYQIFILTIFLTVAFYHLCIFFITLERIYFTFCIVQLAGVFFWSTYFGFPQRFLWPDYSAINVHIVGILISGMALGAVYVSNDFLEFGKISPTFGKIFRFFRNASLAILGCTILISHPLLSLIATTTICCLCSFSVFAAFQKNNIDLSYVLFIAGWGVLCIFITGFGLNKIGFIQPSLLTEIGAPFGNTVLTLFFSIAIAERTNQIKSESYQLMQDNYESKIKEEKAISREKAKSEFLASMSHEIRTPMTGILGMISLLKDTNMEETQQRYVGVIDSSSQSLLQIINDILDYSKIEAGKMSIESIDVDVEQLLHDTLTMFTSRMEEKELTLTLSIDNNVPTSLVSDPVRIKQMLLNYLSNAFKFTHKGGINLHLSIDKTNTTDDDHHQQLRFSVKDTGIGLSQTQINHLFQQFSQADSTTTRQYGGTGLGLSIIKKLSLLMDGDTGVSSVEGKGSEFWFSIRTNKADSTHSFKHTLHDHSVLFEQIHITTQDAALKSSIHRILSQWNIPTDSSPNTESLPFDSSKNTLFLIDQKNLQDEDATVVGNRLIALAKQKVSIAIMGHASSSIENNLKKYSNIQFIEKPITTHLLKTIMCKPLEIQKTTTVRYDNLSDKRLLVVEDNAINQLVIKGILKKAGITPVIANNGKEACQSAENNPFDLILMDCEMPVMDGYDAVRNIRSSNNQNKDTPIFALSAHALQEYRDRAISAGMNGFVVKPIDTKELLSIVYGAVKK
ncbi:hypothetical protein A9Q99_01900 [Gammaproteobacteria bacterium 45_16_T64]|nr:hypothetical protein A9Q99_01900 [Gammaproteobacteria bacterium 45_16_T64]